MPYIGNELATQFQAFVTQTITGDGSTGYTLSRAVANGKELLVYINNVKQEEGSGKSYQATGTTITFTEAVASTDSCYVVFLGSAIQTVAPPDGSLASYTGNASISGTLGVTGAVTANGGAVFNEASADVDFRIESNGRTHALFVDGGNNSVMVGDATVARTVFGQNSSLQIEGTDSTASMSIVKNSNDDNGAELVLGSSRGTSTGANTVVQSGDNLGRIAFVGADGTDAATVGALIMAQVDGTPGGNDLPTRLLFSVTADGASSATEAMRIMEDGHIAIGQDGDQGGHRLTVTETVNDNTMIVRNTNASFSNKALLIVSNRAGNSGFNLIDAESNNESDTEFRVRGDGEVTADGSFSGGGADYAEYFEWKDGNSSSEDRVGISVKLDGDKIVASSDSDNASDIIGVISANPAVTGDSAWNKWNNKYLVDDYGRYIKEEYTSTEWTEVKTNSHGSRQEQYHAYETDKIPSDVTVPSDAKVVSKEDTGAKLTRRKLNPDYDDSKTYIAREDRKEWDMVGLMGKLRIKKGQKTGTNWIKMRDISDAVEEWLVR